MRTRFNVRLFIAVIALSALAPLSAFAKPGVERKNGYYVVTLEGSPYEIGLQQGKLLKAEINDVYTVYLKGLIYNKWIKEYGYLKGIKLASTNPRKALYEFALKQEQYIPQDLKDEMKGIADGAGVDYIDVLNMASHVDYFATLCSTMVATGPATKNGKLIEGRNLDWASGGLKELDKYSMIGVFKPDKGHSFVSVLYPGVVGVLTGLNDSKITAELNFSMAKKNNPTGTPALILMRRLIQNAGSLDEAEKFLRTVPKLAGYNITVTDGKTNDARLIEITADKVDTLGLSDNTLVSTNHFTTKELAGSNIETSGYGAIPSTERYARLKEMQKQNYGKIDAQTAITMMQDKGVRVPGTVQTVVLEPSEMRIWVWARDRKPGDFTEFNVDELLAPQKRTENKD